MEDSLVKRHRKIDQAMEKKGEYILEKRRARGEFSTLCSRARVFTVKHARKYQTARGTRHWKEAQRKREKRMEEKIVENDRMVETERGRERKGEREKKT